MPNLYSTFIIAFVLIVMAIACLAIGWLIKGKTIIEKGACGRDPTKKRNECDEANSNFSCSQCSPPKLAPKIDLENEDDEDDLEEPIKKSDDKL